MEYTHMVIRRETKDELKALMQKAVKDQDGMRVTYSDMIDALLHIAKDLTGEEEILEEIVRVAVEN